MNKILTAYVLHPRERQNNPLTGKIHHEGTTWKANNRVCNAHLKGPFGENFLFHQNMAFF